MGDYLFQAMIIIQMITLIFSQVDSNKIQSRLPSRHLIFNFPQLLKYKTDFPLIIIYHNVSRLRSILSFVAMFLLRFPITYVLWTNQELHGCGLVRTEKNTKGKIVLNKEPKSSFSVGHKRRYKVDFKHLVVA